VIDQLIGKRVSLTGEFTGSVTIESAKFFEATRLLRVRDREGELHKAYLTAAEAILANLEQTSATPVDANQFFLFIE
jgi:hypothetical protein